MAYAVGVKLHCATTNLFAVLLYQFATFHSAVTAVAAIVRAPWIVVFVVTIAVSKVLGRPTTSLGIDALALQKGKH